MYKWIEHGHSHPNIAWEVWPWFILRQSNNAWTTTNKCLNTEQTSTWNGRNSQPQQQQQQLPNISHIHRVWGDPHVDDLNPTRTSKLKIGSFYNHGSIECNMKMLVRATYIQ